MAIRVGSKYEWIRGDYKGNVDEVVDIKDGFIIFKSGKRCNSDIFNEYLIPEGAKMSTATANSNSGPGGGVVTVDFKSEDDGPILDEFGQPVIVPAEIPTLRNNNINNANPINNFVEQPPVVEKKINPITMLINQASKDEIVLNLNYNAKLPKKSVYLLIKDSFENVDVDNEIIESIFSEININELKEYFKKELLEQIKLHYKQ